MPTVENHLIELLPRNARRQLLAICKPVLLTVDDVLCEPGAPTRYVYFPTDGFISLVTLDAGSPGLEVGMVGSEGMLGVQAGFGVATAPSRAVVQGVGTAWRIDARAFRSEVASSAPLHRGLARYVCVLMAQLTTSATCLRFHTIHARLARWLLMSHDRAEADSFMVTHEFMAYVLGVRRVSVTTAAGALQRSGLIEYRRGALTVLDRGGLEAAACGCYASNRKAYADVLG